MSKQDSLHTLIQTLTKSEKRHFKLLAQRASKDKILSYQQLFDLLVEMTDFNQDQIKEGMGWENFRSKYPMAKKYLEAKILEALHTYEKQDTTKERLKTLIAQIETLLQRRLYDHAKRKIKLGKQWAYKAEEFQLLLTILKLERKVLIKHTKEVFSESHLTSINSEIKNAIRGIEVREATSHLHYRFFSLYNHANQNTMVRESLDQLIVELPGMWPSLQPYFFPRATYHNILSQYNYFKGDFEASFQEVSKIVTMFDQHPEKKKELIFTYVSALHNYCNRCFLIKDYAACLKTFHALESFSSPLPQPEMQRVSSYFSAGMVMVINSGYTLSNQKFFDLLCKTIRSTAYDFSRRFLLQMKLLCVSFEFLNENYTAAHNWMLEIIQDETHTKIKPYYRFIPYLEVIIHLELGNISFLEYRVRSLLRSAKTEDAYPMETFLITHLKGIAFAKDQAEVQTIALALFTHLQSIRDDRLLNPSQLTFDFEGWAEAKAKGKVQRELLIHNWNEDGRSEMILA